jgi:putative NIF3 family GTP cyclohydrolase 1 type 2
MDVATLIAVLEGLAPELSADNFVNIPAGKAGVSVKRLGVCVDPTEYTIAGAVKKGINILISYHPWYGEAERLIRNGGIGIIPLHTAWDNVSQGANVTFAKEIGLENITVAADIVHGKTDTVVKHLLEKCQRAVDQNIIPYFGEPRNPVKKVAVWTGPGFLPYHRKLWETCLEEGCDTIISGELGLAPLRFAADHKLQLIDLGHSRMAKPGMVNLARIIKGRLGQSGCSVEFFADCYGCNYYTNFSYSQPNDSEDFISLFTRR